VRGDSDDVVVGDAGLDEQAHDEVRERIGPVELLGQLGFEAVAEVARKMADEVKFAAETFSPVNTVAKLVSAVDCLSNVPRRVVISSIGFWSNDVSPVINLP